MLRRVSNVISRTVGAGAALATLGSETQNRAAVPPQDTNMAANLAVVSENVNEDGYREVFIGAVSQVAANPSLIPGFLGNSEPTRMAQHAARNPLVVAEAMRQWNLMNGAQMGAGGTENIPNGFVSAENGSQRMNTLRQSFPCNVCHSVLAAPALLPCCGHSFCGCCAEVSYRILSCNSLPILLTLFGVLKKYYLQTIDRCPTCNAVVVGKARFEETLSSNIDNLMRAVPPCGEKDAWEVRKNKYWTDELDRLNAELEANGSSIDDFCRRLKIPLSFIKAVGFFVGVIVFVACCYTVYDYVYNSEPTPLAV